MPKCRHFLAVAFLVIVYIIINIHRPILHDHSSQSDSSSREVQPINAFPIQDTEKERLTKGSNRLSQDDPHLQELIISGGYLHFPSQQKLVLDNPKIEDHSQSGQGKFLAEYLQRKKFGRFFEAGGLDGEFYSNTLYLERFLNWTGILVESDPKFFQKMMSKHRNTVNIKACLSPEPNHMVLPFDPGKVVGWGHLESTANSSENAGLIMVNCFPLYSILNAVGMTTLDVLSLDVEGFELKILKTIPWEKVNIEIIILEWSHTHEGPEAIKEFMKESGYLFLRSIEEDFIFVKN